MKKIVQVLAAVFIFYFVLPPFIVFAAEDCLSCHSKGSGKTCGRSTVPAQSCPALPATQLKPKSSLYPTWDEVKALGKGRWIIAGPEAAKVMTDCYSQPKKKIKKWQVWELGGANHLRFCGKFSAPSGDPSFDVGSPIPGYDKKGWVIIFTLYDGYPRLIAWKGGGFYEWEEKIKFSWKGVK